MGTTRIACLRFETAGGAGCFGGRGADIALARARDVAATPCVPRSLPLNAEWPLVQRRMVEKRRSYRGTERKGYGRLGKVRVR